MGRTGSKFRWACLVGSVQHMGPRMKVELIVGLGLAANMVLEKLESLGPPLSRRYSEMDSQEKLNADGAF